MITAVAYCSYNEVLVGTGAEISGGDGDVMFMGVVPTKTSLSVTATEDQAGTTEVWSVTAHAYCAPEPPEYEIDSEIIGGWPDAKHLSWIECPPGMGVLCAGGLIFNSTPYDISLTKVDPVVLRSYDAYYASVSAQSDVATSLYSFEWDLQGYAICAEL